MGTSSRPSDGVSISPVWGLRKHKCAIIIGILIVRYRKSLASGTAEAQRAMFGRFGEFVASQSRPSGALIAGIGFIVIGVAALLMGLFIPPGEWGC